MRKLFFTANLAERRAADLLARQIRASWEVTRQVKDVRPFVIRTMALHREHLHPSWRGGWRCRLADALVID